MYLNCWGQFGRQRLKTNAASSLGYSYKIGYLLQIELLAGAVKQILLVSYAKQGMSQVSTWSPLAHSHYESGIRLHNTTTSKWRKYQLNRLWILGEKIPHKPVRWSQKNTSRSWSAWNLWKERCRRVFDHKELSVQLVAIIKCDISNYRMAHATEAVVI